VLNIAFFGSDPIALPLLNWLYDEAKDSVHFVAIFTQPDRPVGRGQKLRANEIKQWAVARNLPVYQPDRLDAVAQKAYAELATDLSLVMAYGHIFKQDFIDTPRLGTVNLHTSQLPKYRGASPIQTAIAMGDDETGVSLMRIVRALDAGPVTDCETVSIGRVDTALDIEAKLAEACVPLVSRNLAALASEDLMFTEQNHDSATFCRRLVKGDGGLDFSASARTLAARINGLFPWPATVLPINGQLIKAGLATAEEGDGAAGVVMGSDQEGLLIGTGEGILRLHKLQRPGAKMLPVNDFLRGFPVEVGTKISSVEMTPLVADAPFRR